ncbi:MAG: hypothetical protein ABJO06_21660 [Roseibium sp.]|uniref:hypothetical protein n=1 Tax=Roseibium sp. TaxID=1936156 RepID=UPI0032982980
MAKRDPMTPDLFTDYTPPEVALGFGDRVARGGDLASRISRAIGRALKDCGKDRETVAADMSARLGTPVSASVLDAYASEAKQTHNITVERFAAPIHATGQRQLMGFLGAEFDLAVVPSKYETVIQLALLNDHMAGVADYKKLLEARIKGAK